MCLVCERVWSILHVLWSTIYVICGAAQLVSGIFFLISIPSLHLSCNLWAGTWNIFVGIGTGMVACFGQLSARRQELLLYMAVSILIVNSVNAVLSEWGYYLADMKKLLSAHQYQVLISYAGIATRASSAVVIIVAFLDSQLSFCSMQSIPKQQKKKARGSHEQVSDIEYIIPRRKSSKPHTVYNAYSQSWVYDADFVNAAAATSNHQTADDESPYLQVPREDTPKHSIGRRRSGLENGIIGDTAHLIDNPVVHVEEASDDSNSNSDRKLCYMKSFSRSASPVVLSASSSQISLNNPPIYEYLQKLTEPEIYRSRLNSALSNKSSEEGPQYQAPQPIMTRRDPVSPHVEKVQYASLMKELQKAIVSKKEPSQITPPSNSESVTSSDKTSRTDNTKNSDAEFSKELEAALQLIQDLESPNTIETPSEPKVFGEKEDRSLSVWRNSDASESEKTLSAVGSLAEIGSPLNECQPEMTTFKPSSAATINGKSARVIIQNSESQSTSGYSSPTHKTPDWSTTSSVSSSNHDLGVNSTKPSNLTYTIHNTKSTAVISLYTGESPKAKNVTLVKITGNNERCRLPPPILSSTLLNEHDFHNNNNVTNVKSNLNNNLSHPLNITNVKNNNTTGNLDGSYDCQTDDEKYDQQNQRRASVNSGNLWNVRSLLRKKKNVPKLCAELEGAIIKSESLAYLSEIELVARHQRNKDIQRQIEQRVLQQLGTPRTESNC